MMLNKKHELLSLIVAIKKMADSEFLKITDPKKSYDLMVFAVVSRVLKQARGFAMLIEDKSYECAMTILRCQIDTAARFNALWLCAEGADYCAKKFLDPKGKFNNLTSKDLAPNGKKQKLVDAYLVEQLKEYGAEIKELYEYACRSAHLSEQHLRSAMTMNKVGDGKHYEFSGCITDKDVFIEEKDYIYAMDEFIKTTTIACNILRKFFEERLHFEESPPGPLM